MHDLAVMLPLASIASEIGRAFSFFLALAALLLWRFLRTKGPAMLRMLNKSMGDGHEHGATPSHG